MVWFDDHYTDKAEYTDSDGTVHRCWIYVPPPNANDSSRGEAGGASSSSDYPRQSQTNLAGGTFFSGADLEGFEEILLHNSNIDLIQDDIENRSKVIIQRCRRLARFNDKLAKGLMLRCSEEFTGNTEEDSDWYSNTESNMLPQWKEYEEVMRIVRTTEDEGKARCKKLYMDKKQKQAYLDYLNTRLEELKKRLEEQSQADLFGNLLDAKDADEDEDDDDDDRDQDSPQDATPKSHKARRRERGVLPDGHKSPQDQRTPRTKDSHSKKDSAPKDDWLGGLFSLFGNDARKENEASVKERERREDKKSEPEVIWCDDKEPSQTEKEAARDTNGFGEPNSQSTAGNNAMASADDLEAADLAVVLQRSVEDTNTNDEELLRLALAQSVKDPGDKDEGEKKWTCPSCTFLNPCSAVVCEMCEAPRPGATYDHLERKDEGPSWWPWK